MACAKSSLLLDFLTVTLLLAFSEVEGKESGLVMSGYSDKEVHGCYNFNASLGLCFSVHPGFIKLATKDGEIMVFHREISEGLSLFQICDDHFVRFRSQVIVMPADAPTSPDELLDYWDRNFGSRKESMLSEGDQERLKVKYQDAMKKLSENREVLLLELLSSALAAQEHQVEALVSFHETCRVLLQVLAVQLPTEFRSAGTSSSGVDQKHGREKRCTDLSSYPNNNKCLGMCGRSCACWQWICGDCCYHGGCYEHDRCCSANYWSSYCLIPIAYNFSCNDGYGGYPECLTS